MVEENYYDMKNTKSILGKKSVEQLNIDSRVIQRMTEKFIQTLE